MPTNYFSHFPNTTFLRAGVDRNNPYELNPPDIFIRFKVRDTIINDGTIFYPYIWRESDTPETVAFKYYGDSRYFWLVFYSNNAFDLNYDFPMTPATFDRFVFLKYQDDAAKAYNPGNPALFFTNFDEDEQLIETVAWAKSNTKMYGIDSPEIIVDFDTYTAFNGVKRQISFYTYEEELNEAKRNIKLLDSAYLNRIIREFTADMSKARAQAEA